MTTLIFPHVLLRIYKVICLLRGPGRSLNGTVKAEAGESLTPPGLQTGHEQPSELGDLGRGRKGWTPTRKLLWTVTGGEISSHLSHEAGLTRLGYNRVGWPRGKARGAQQPVEAPRCVCARVYPCVLGLHAGVYCECSRHTCTSVNTHLCMQVCVCLGCKRRPLLPTPPRSLRCGSSSQVGFRAVSGLSSREEGTPESGTRVPWEGGRAWRSHRCLQSLFSRVGLCLLSDFLVGVLWLFLLTCLYILDINHLSAR